MRRLLRSQSGFTLIELAIVVAIAAVVLGTVVSLVSSQLEQARASNARAKLETARSALVMFVARNSRLPCPAIETLLPSNAAYGFEAATPGTCTGATAAGTAVRGMLPFRSLGLSEEDALDVYGSRFTYVVTTTATNRNESNIAGLTGSIMLHNATPPAPGRAPTGNQINACSTTAGDNSCNANAVVLVLSHGRNAEGAFLPSGSRAPLPTSALELANTDTDASFVLTSYSESAPVFDDMLLALTPDMLLANLMRDGAIRSARAVTYEQMQTVQDAALSYILNNDGTVSVKMPLPAAPNDGWGTALQYSTTLLAVCGAAPGTIAFTIKSLGADRIDGPAPSGVNDDIIRNVTVDPIKGYVAKIRGDTCP